MTDNNPLVSVCIISRGPGALLTACLQSLRDQIDPPSFELLVGSRRRGAIGEEVLAMFPSAGLADIARSLPGGGRNLLIERARGDLLLFIDDDVIAHPHLLSRLVRLAAEQPETGVFGGPNLTPPASSRFQVVQGAVLGSIVTSGPIRRRYGKHPSGPADERSLILCNLAIRRDAMRPFEADLACAEENQLLSELERQGVAMQYDPQLIVFHERRDTPKGFAKQIFKYGYGRGQVIRRNPKGSRLSYLIPSATFAYLAVSPLLALASPWALAPVLAYGGFVTIGAAKVAFSMRRRRASLFPVAAFLIVLVHSCYGVGVIAGIAAPIRSRPDGGSRAVLDSDSRAFETTEI